MSLLHILVCTHVCLIWMPLLDAHMDVIDMRKLEVINMDLILLFCTMAFLMVAILTCVRLTAHVRGRVAARVIMTGFCVLLSVELVLTVMVFMNMVHVICS